MGSSTAIQPYSQGLPSSYDPATPWNRQPFDDDEQWHAFRLYLMGAIPRQLHHVASKTTHTVSQLQSWAKSRGWFKRAEAFDNWIHQRFTDEVAVYVEQTAVATAERHLSPLRDGIELASQELKKLLKASQEQTMHGLIRPAELTRLLRECIKLERLITGESTERVEHGPIDLESLSVDELRALQTIQAKLGTQP